VKNKPHRKKSGARRASKSARDRTRKLQSQIARIGKRSPIEFSGGVDDEEALVVAVLPFENLSEEKANAYFADGIQDEILTRLSKIAELKVISRTSTQHYKSAPENLPEIARQLGVGKSAYSRP
jgi:TolB-like protein